MCEVTLHNTHSHAHTYHIQGRPNNITMDDLCAIMTNKSIKDPLARYASVNKFMLSSFKEDTIDCSFKNMIQELSNTSWNSSAAEGGK